MPYRTLPFVSGETYHVFNRSIARFPIFNGQTDMERIIKLIDYYRFGKLPLRFSHYKNLPHQLKDQYAKVNFVDEKRALSILAYCIMPNHFHFLIKPLKDNSISDFMRNIQNGFSKYFNLKYERTGSLFQFMFKAVHIETDEQLIHVSRYIHLNPSTSYIVNAGGLTEYPWSSFADYLSNEKGESIVDTDFILSYFKQPQKYKEFVFDQIDYQRELDKIKHLILE